MSLSEAVILAVAKSIVTSVLRVWVADGNPVGDATDKAIQALLDQRLPTLVDRRKATRSLEAVEDYLSEHMTPILKGEYTGLTTDERQQVIHQVIRSLNSLAFVGTGLTLLDLEPGHIAAAIRSGKESVLFAQGLSAKGEQFYYQCLDEAASYVTSIVIGLPRFQRVQPVLPEHSLVPEAGSDFQLASLPLQPPDLATEHLRQQNRMVEKVAEILDTMPRASRSSGHSDDARFDLAYRREVVRRLDYMETPGLPGRREHRISLSAGFVEPSGLLVRSATGDYPVRLPTFSRRHRRILIRGEAGCGKSTLLKWLSVRLAQSEANTLDGAQVPLYIPLARFDVEARSPDDLLACVSPTIGFRPDGWMHRTLERGQACVLLDGLDEVPPAARGRVHEWAVALSENYPLSTVIVAGRPESDPNEDFARSGFATVQVGELSIPEAERCIEFWHRAAAAQETEETEAARILSLDTPLRRKVRETPQLARLARTPLLAAMICSLNRDSAAHLPNVRTELYSVAINHMLTRRIPLLPEINASLTQVRPILEDLAYWMSLNGLIETGVASAIRSFDQSLRNTSSVTKSSDLLDWLVTGAGLLREPTPGTVSFVHRSFQEYLTACACVRLDNTGLIVNRAVAVDDGWNEVVVSFAALATNPQRDKLFESLLSTASNEDPRARRRLLLASACVGSSPVIKPWVAQRVATLLASLFPLRSESEVGSIAASGALAVQHLRYVDGMEPESALLHVRALTRVGDESALMALAGFAAGAGDALRAELVRAWSFFPPEEYAISVLSVCSWDAPMKLEDPGRQAWVPHVRGVASVTGDYRAASQVSIQASLCKEQLDRITVEGNTEIRRLGILAGYTRLRVLDARECPELRWTEVREGLPELRDLDLSGCSALEDIMIVRNSPNLRTLRLEHAGPRIWLETLFGAAPRLAVLDLRGTLIPEKQLRKLLERPGLRELIISTPTQPYSEGVSSHPIVRVC